MAAKSRPGFWGSNNPMTSPTGPLHRVRATPERSTDAARMRVAALASIVIVAMRSARLQRRHAAMDVVASCKKHVGQTADRSFAKALV